MSKQIIDYKSYYDRILACWIGKSLGGIIGAPYENHKNFNQVTYDKLWPEILYPNDDLDIQVVWLEALQKLGPYLTSRKLADFWHENCFYTCCEYGIFIDNLEHGIYPPLSGRWNNPFFQGSEGCPIRSDIWGLISPGNPVLAMHYAGMDGCLDHGPVSIQLEQFYSAVTSLAFFENDLNKVLDQAIAVTGKENAAVEVVENVRKICSQTSNEHDVWRKLVRLYGHHDASRGKMNLAIVLAALFQGGNDFKKIIHICVQYGWDADCSAASAGAIYGTMHGSASLPQDWQAKMGKTLICACEIAHQYTALTDFARETAEIGCEIALGLNKNCCVITNAPVVTLRSEPDPEVEIKAVYANDEPLLRVNRATDVTLQIINPTGKCFDGILELCADKHLLASVNAVKLHLPPGETAEVKLNVSYAYELDYLENYNFVNVMFKEASTGEVIAQDKFGFFAAPQFMVYGPYWDMYDHDRFDECPYQNDKVKCNPSAIPGCLDYFNHHVRHNHAYLDEDKLMIGELPEELPFVVELPSAVINNSDLSGFVGECCYYIVSDFIAEELLDEAVFGVSRNAPCKFYLDGEKCFDLQKYTCWAPECDYSRTFKLNGKPQRVVVKISCEREDFKLSWGFSSMVFDKRYAKSPRCKIKFKNYLKDM